MMIEGTLDETCTIKHVNSITRDTFGSPTESVTSTATRCKFIPATNTRVIIGTNERFMIPLKVILPHTVSINDGDTITSTESGYSGTYRVDSYAPMKTRFGISTGFILCELIRYG